MNLLQLFPLKSEDRCGTGLCADDFLEHPIVFVERFWKCRDSLMLVAYRVLGDRKAATAVVESCFRRACSEPPRFASEGAFGCWLLRILIEESLQERRRRRWAPKGHCHQSFTGAAACDGALGHLDDFWCLDNSV
ncbi:MAG TPA: sigma factor [Candidatus Saccharimonadales bacterium]|nr:sigma factor [Candidatus Saccharimonadales bacterium]